MRNPSKMEVYLRNSMVNPGKSELEKINSMQGFIIQNVPYHEMPPDAVKTHQGRLRRIALDKCIYLKIRIVIY